MVSNQTVGNFCDTATRGFIFTSPYPHNTLTFTSNTSSPLILFALPKVNTPILTTLNNQLLSIFQQLTIHKSSLSGLQLNSKHRSSQHSTQVFVNPSRTPTITHKSSLSQSRHPQPNPLSSNNSSDHPSIRPALRFGKPLSTRPIGLLLLCFWHLAFNADVARPTNAFPLL